MLTACSSWQSQPRRYVTSGDTPGDWAHRSQLDMKPLHADTPQMLTPVNKLCTTLLLALSFTLWASATSTANCSITSTSPLQFFSSDLSSARETKSHTTSALMTTLAMTAPRAPAQALLMHWQRHLSFRKNPSNHSSPFCFPLNPTPLAHHSNYTFFLPPTLCASFLSHQIKATFVHSQDLPRANHSLIHYLCLLLPSISPSCHLSSHTRHFQTSFVLSSVLFLIQRRGQPASYLIDLFQILLSNLCLHTEEKLGIPASCGCAEPILTIRSCRFAFPTALSPLVASCLGHTELFRAGAISVNLLLYIYEPWLGI